MIYGGFGIGWGISGSFFFMVCFDLRVKGWVFRERIFVGMIMCIYGDYNSVGRGGFWNI